MFPHLEQTAITLPLPHWTGVGQIQLLHRMFQEVLCTGTPWSRGVLLHCHVKTHTHTHTGMQQHSHRHFRDIAETRHPETQQQSKHTHDKHGNQRLQIEWGCLGNGWWEGTLVIYVQHIFIWAETGRQGKKPTEK